MIEESIQEHVENFDQNDPKVRILLTTQMPCLFHSILCT